MKALQLIDWKTDPELVEISLPDRLALTHGNGRGAISMHASIARRAEICSAPTDFLTVVGCDSCCEQRRPELYAFVGEPAARLLGQLDAHRVGVEVRAIRWRPPPGAGFTVTVSISARMARF